MWTLLLGWRGRLETPGSWALLWLHVGLSSEGAVVAGVRILPTLGGLGHITCLLGSPLTPLSFSHFHFPRNEIAEIAGPVGRACRGHAGWPIQRVFSGWDFGQALPPSPFLPPQGSRHQGIVPPCPLPGAGTWGTQLAWGCLTGVCGHQLLRQGLRNWVGPHWGPGQPLPPLPQSILELIGYCSSEAICSLWQR